MEAAVQVAQRWVLAPLRNRRFFSVGEWNEAVAVQVAILNRKPFRGSQISRRDLFEDLDRPALQPLPGGRYELSIWKPVKVNIDYHVEFESHYYSVSYKLVRERVEVRATKTAIEIIHRSRRVASHARSRVRGDFTTNPEHMPASHRAHLEWTPSRLIKWAGTLGPGVARSGWERAYGLHHPLASPEGGLATSPAPASAGRGLRVQLLWQPLGRPAEM